ncbi:DUF1702 family protein [Nocardiopsis metallicus]|uniref:Enediyne biosynthesis protein n=1 Tax=Nocardiopsis metallicus TaxID=179819 RepID=A0A840W284_9ACTN|nr:DUF1702 family protein [Nocardiopsis metallicus]MBB5490939.1 hypothetical protein [Nocardiopsis metallicus]
MGAGPRPVGALGRMLLAPPLHRVGFAHLGFPGRDSPSARRLERIPEAVVCGFEWGIEARDPREVEHRLETVAPDLRGFAFEGVAMAYTIRDALPLGGRDRTREFMLGPALPHTFLTYIGIGFAMSRLPRPLWRNILPDLEGNPYHPTMSWLAVDGYGFDLAYFDAPRWIDGQRTPRPYPWEGAPEYFPRAFDQGLGRALWFVHGARHDGVAAAVGRFPRQRRPDLWSGVGLAAVFAGGASPAQIRALLDLAGEDAPHVFQGAVFAAKARVFSGHVPEHTEVGVQALTGMDSGTAASLADRQRVEPGGGGTEPAYEVWRARVRRCFFWSAPDPGPPPQGNP